MHHPSSLIAFIVLLICAACGAAPNPDAGLELSDEQLNALIKNRHIVPNEDNGDAALAQLEAAYKTDSSQIDNVYNLAYMYTARCISDSSHSECPRALQYLTRVIGLQRDYRSGNAFYNRMLCYQHLGQYEAALADLNIFAEMHKNDEKPPVNFYYQKAVLLQQLGKIAEACAELKNAEKLDTTGLSDLMLPCK